MSNLCGNECTYCAFRARNTELERRALTQEEIARETRMLIDQGHKRVLLVAGESYPREGFSYVLKAIDTVYSVTHDQGEIRRVNVNVAPLTLDEFRELKAAKIGTYQLFQETYHRGTYAASTSPARRRTTTGASTAMDRAMEAGIDDVGIGVLFGLFDWRFEVLALMQHIRHLEARFGVGPHTLSVPRLEPATGSDVAGHPPQPVSDVDFRKIVAILRLAVPYTGIIMSTRESAHIRRETFALGVSQISAGSRTNPGGYAESEREDASQFCLGDHRPLDEVIRDVAGARLHPVVLHGLLPARPDRAGLHGPRQAGRDQGALRPERAGDLRRVPRRLRVGGDSRRGRAARGARAGVDGTGSQTDGRQHGDTRPRRKTGRVLLTREKRDLESGPGPTSRIGAWSQ